MAVFSEVDALIDLVNRAFNLVQSIGRGWYKDSQAIESFADQVQFLRLKAENWSRLLKRYGPHVRNLVRPTLETAMMTLEREDERMRSRQASCLMRWSYRTLNIADASTAIQSVCQAFEGISRTIEDHWKADRILDQISKSDLAVLPFRLDKKYVPLLQPLEAVKGALERVGGPPVVVLYGEPGSGKTAMAKYLAIHYDKLRRQQEIMALDPSTEQNAAESHFFSDGVFFLDCGPAATSKGLHEELWQNLGFKANFDVDARHDTTFVNQHYSESMLHKQLMGRLADSTMLIVLDDVWETEVVERLLLPGSGLKYLITTQDKRVWAEAVQINVAKPSLEDARQILVNHVVGLKELPQELLDVADDIIEKSEFNPLVLANLALTISSERATNLDEWLTVRKYLRELLDDDRRSPLGYEKSYPRSVASTMTMAVNSMSVEMKNLLFLAAVCDGPTVPEIVIKIFFKVLVGSLARFQKWSNYLEDHDFLQIQTHVVEWTTVPQKTWSLHSLRQHFVREKKKDDVSSMVSVLLSANHKDVDIVSAIFVLFAAESYTQENGTRLQELLGISRGIKEENFPWTSIKPFVWQLQVDSDEEWQRNASAMAKKVIVNFVRYGDLDDTGLSNLLQSPQAQFATCWALETIARLEQRVLTEKHEESLKSLIALLDWGARPKTKSWGAVVLGALAINNHKIILAQPLALKNLLGLLLGPAFDDENLQVYAAWTLGNLAATSSAKDVIASYPGMLEALLKLLDKNEYPAVEVEAAYALRRLAYGAQVTTEGRSRQMKMIALPGMLDKLAALLIRETDPDVQKEVVWLLGNLAASREERIVLGNYPGLLDSLVGLLSIEDAEFDSQRYHAAYALRRITLREANPKLFRIPGARECLVKLLFAFEHPDVQQEAVHCLSFIVYPEENGIEFAAIPGALKGLVGLLFADCVSPSTQLIATGTLANLMETDQNKLLIASVPGALEGLVKMLTKTGAPPDVLYELTELALRCLLQLSINNYENQLTIASLPGALEGLLELLGLSNSGVQLLAVWTLSNLVYHNYKNQLTIALFPGALEGLVELLSWSNSRVQLLAVWILSNLAEAEENRTRIRDLPSAVRNLTGLLQAEGLDAEVQEYAENALTLVLSSEVAPKRTPSTSNLGGSFQKREPTMNDEAIKDIDKNHSLYVPREHIFSNNRRNTVSCSNSQGFPTFVQSQE